MKFVVMGDIGKQILYHVGDEAMTEAAIAMLRQRDADAEITLVATDPEVAEERYGLPAVPRFGYLFDWSRLRLEAALSDVTAGIPGDHGRLHDSVREADAVVIAGGGNMNSKFAYHLYERASLKRVAEHYGKPLFVTSQTIGPELLPRDEELLAEIITYASCFGAREAASYTLALALGGVQNRVVHTLDDAFMLEAREDDREVVAGLGLGDRYVVAGLTSHQGTTALSDDEYAASLVATLDELAARLDADIALAPHVGSFDPANPISDQLLATELVKRSAGGRLRPMPMLTARQHLALTASSLLTVSTRYHPTVFGAAVSVPAVAVTTSYYSSVRIRGSMANVGLTRYVVPAALWQDALPAMLELATRDDYRRHMAKAWPGLLQGQEAWWDAIVQAARTGQWGGAENIRPVEQLRPLGEWSREVEQVTPVFDELGRERIRAFFAAQDLQQATDDLRQAKSRLVKTQQELAKTRKLLEAATLEHTTTRAKLAALRRRKAIRVADALAGLAHRIIPGQR